MIAAGASGGAPEIGAYRVGTTRHKRTRPGHRLNSGFREDAEGKDMRSTSILALVAVVVAVLVVPSRAISCRTEPERCKEGECCVEFGTFGRCRPLLKEGDDCELKSLKSKFNDHVYLMKCECGVGLTCEEDDIGSSLQGKCVQK